MNPTIAAVYFVHNDLPFLRATLPYEKKWVDQICILDLGSTDGTKEFCEHYLDHKDVYQRREENTAPTLGFSEAKNAASALATSDWLFYAAADQMLLPKDRCRIHSVLKSTHAAVLSMDTINIFARRGDGPHSIEQGLLRSADPNATKVESHRRLVRREANVVSKGYIHEEPFIGEVNCYSLAKASGLSIVHFEDWHNSELRRMRYSWMILRAIQNPDLQAHTNKWWYAVYFPQNEVNIRIWAKQYEEYVASTGLK